MSKVRCSFLQLHGFVLFVLAAAFSTLPVFALDINGYMPDAGAGAVAVTYTAESYDEFWVGTTKVADPGVGQVDTDSLSVWFTWGFTENLAIVANAAYVDVTSDGLGGFGDSGAQDLAALVKYRFVNRWNGDNHHSLAGAVGVRTPISSYEGNLPVDLGDDTTDGLFRLVYQFERGPFYYSQQVGFDSRGEDAPDGIPVYTELGFTHGRATWTGIYSRYFADGGTDIGDPGFTFPSNKDEYERLALKLFLRLNERFGLSFVGFTTLDGRNSGDISGFSAGFSANL